MITDLTGVPTAARTLSAEWTRLVGAQAPSGRFAADLLTALPEPAQRWLNHSIVPGTPLWSSVVLTMRGRIKLGRWCPFTARQVLAPPEGFIWAAVARVAGLPVAGFDRYSSGVGQMRWRLLGLVPVATGAGADITRSAAGRLAGEGTCWLPTAFLAARWSSGPDLDTAVATWSIGGDHEAVQIRVEPDGRLRDVRLQRWGNPDGQTFDRYPFRVAVEAERTFAGVTIPARIRAAWLGDGDRRDPVDFFRCEVTDAVFS